MRLLWFEVLKKINDTSKTLTWSCCCNWTRRSLLTSFWFSKKIISYSKYVKRFFQQTKFPSKFDNQPSAFWWFWWDTPFLFAVLIFSNPSQGSNLGFYPEMTGFFLTARTLPSDINWWSSIWGLSWLFPTRVKHCSPRNRGRFNCWGDQELFLVKVVNFYSD